MAITTEVFRLIYADHEGVSIRVGPGPDGFGVGITTEHDSASKEYFGPFSLTLTHELADALGQTLIAAASESA